MPEIPIFESQLSPSPVAGPRASLGAAAATGDALARAAASIADEADAQNRLRRQEQERQRRLNDAATVQKTLSDFDRKLIEERQKRIGAGQAESPGFAAEFDDFAREQLSGIRETASQTGLSPEGMAILSERGTALLDNYFERNFAFQGEALKQAGLDAMASSFNELALTVRNDPAALDKALRSVDDVLADFETSFDPNTRRDARATARVELIASAVRARADAGDFAGAKELLAGGRFAADLDPGAAEQLRAELEREQKAVEADRERVASKAAAEAEARQKAQNEFLGSELEIAVSRGTGGYDDVERAFSGGIISAAKRTELTKALDNQTEEAGKDMGRIGLIQLALDGRVTLDPKSSDHRKAANVYFDQVLLPSLAPTESAPGRQAQPLQPGEAESRIVDFATRTGIVPDALAGQLRGQIRSGTADGKAQAADTIARLREKNPALLDDFATADIALALSIADQVRAGVEPAMAVERAEKARSVPESELAVRRERYRIEKAPEANAAFLTDALEGGGLFAESAQIPDAAIGEFEQTVKGLFEAGSDLESARKIALDELQRTWAVTRVGANKRLMKYAPEAVYGIIDHGNRDSTWIEDQLLDDMSAIGFKELSSDKLLLGSDAATARGNPPTYPVLELTDSGPEPLLLDDGRTVRWRPDYAASAAGRKQQAEIDAELAAATARRATARTPAELATARSNPRARRIPLPRPAPSPAKTDPRQAARDFLGGLRGGGLQGFTGLKR